MIRTLAASFIALGLALALPACAQPAPEPAAPAPRDSDPALWVVKDADTTIYLFGTIHVLQPGLSWFDDAVRKAFDASSTLVLEMVEPDVATQQKIVLAKAFAPAGTPPLSQQLSPASRATMTEALARHKLPLEDVDRMRPWFAAVTLSILPLQNMGFDPANGPETVLSDAARRANKPVVGLETFEGQMALFDHLTPQGQMGLLDATIRELPTIRQTMDRMVATWSAGDPDTLALEMNETLKDTPEVAQKLLVERNATWATWIADRMRRPGTVFMAVGAGHLAGSQSVQAQLESRYKVKAVRVKY